ncbi:MAG: Crp/Fnr family transcriptional regulator [Minwuia sp.]|uniref:Crp/Fnr family transcriptional regulator n=1 Tax=Minwuia sp. TaxID=2493630 RepID=UPI003A89104E
MPLVDKLDRFMPLTNAERDAISSCIEPEREMQAGGYLVRQGEPYDGSYVMLDGWSVRQKYLRDGRRQVMNFLIRGDAVGFAATFFKEADHSVMALTDIVYARMNHERLMRLIADNPRLGTAMFWSVALEEAMLRERIVGLGQRSAREHMAHLIMEMVARQRHAGIEGAAVHLLPINQILLSDALGISPVHTNRTIRRLVLDRLISTSPRGIEVLDEERLAETGDFDGQFLHEAGED